VLILPKGFKNSDNHFNWLIESISKKPPAVDLDVLQEWSSLAELNKSIQPAA